LALLALASILSIARAQFGGLAPNGHVYLIFDWVGTYQEALDAASSPQFEIFGLTGGHLVTIADPFEQFIMSEVFDGFPPFWVGLRDVSEDSAFRKDVWQDGVEKGIVNQFHDSWYAGEEHLLSPDACVASDPNGWWRTSCSSSFFLMVEYECPPGLIYHLTPFGPQCRDAGFYNQDRTHYYAIPLQLYNWGTALQVAHQSVFKCRPAHLATITSHREMSIKLHYPTIRAWIAGNNIVHNENEVRTKGSTDDDGRYYVWGDGPEKGQPVKWQHNDDELTDDGWNNGLDSPNFPQEPNSLGAACLVITPSGWDNQGCNTVNLPMFEWECPPGFKFGDQCCEVINQCKINNGGCGENSNCLKNSAGPYFCRCKAGYVSTSDPRDGKNCVPIDLCNRPSPYGQHNPCGQHSTCTVTGSSPYDAKVLCACNNGYYSHTGDGRYCLPTYFCNAPDSNNGGCGPHSTCTNPTQDTVVCSCNAGYHSMNTPQDGRKCAPIDTCAIHPKICGSASTCTTNAAVAGGYTCQCWEGFATEDADQKNCIRITTPDIDPQPEVTLSPVQVDSCNSHTNNAECIQTAGCGWCYVDNYCYSGDGVAFPWTQAPWDCKNNNALFNDDD